MSSLVGTAALVRLALRRDRVVLPVFVVIVVVMVAASADATMKLYPSQASRELAAVAINSATPTLALYGPIYDKDSIGALATFKMGIMGAVAVAVLALLIVVRHTRTEEETGRLELLGSTVVGRRAPLTAALMVAAGAALVTGLGTALASVAVGLPLAGSVVMGLSYALIGAAFAAVAGVTAQLVRSARSASGLAGVVLGVAYLLRAIGDAAAGSGLTWLSWLSPVGWWQQTRPYAGDRWWVMLLLVAFTLLSGAVAYALAARRDFAAGMLPEKAGPATAVARLRSPLALAWRLQRGSFASWAVVFIVLGVVVGGLAGNIDSFLKTKQIRDFITTLGGVQRITDAFFALELAFAGIFAAVFGVISATRLRSEEAELRAEPLLAGAVTRIRWACSHLAVALAGSAALLLLVGVSAGTVAAIQTGDAGRLGDIAAGALVQVPAVWVVVGIVALAFGLAPQHTYLGWAALTMFTLLGEFGPLFNLSQAVMDVSPFAHVPKLPGAHFTVVPLAWLTAIAAGLIVAGLAGFRRRDVG